MTPEDFSRFCDLVPDGLMLLSGDGRVLGVNRVAQRRLGSETGSPVGCELGTLVQTSGNKVAEFLRQCRRSRDEVVAAFALDGNEDPIRFFGRLVRSGTSAAETTLLVRLPDEDKSFNRFSILSRKIDELSSEITRRRALELELREQHDLAAFGRDVGLALAEFADIEGMLGQCAELMVQHLGAAFARIWIIDDSRQTLELKASAGQYTHRDGKHSRIAVGQFKIGLIAQEQKPHLTNDVIGDDRVHDQQWARREGMVAFAGYPLVVDNRTIGVMAIFARRPLSDNTLTSMASVANSIALGAERKRIEVALKEHAGMLQAADRRKDEFLAMLAHELRNPLAPIRSGLELFEQESGEDETLTLMKEQVHHLSRLVDDLLDVSRIMRGRIDLRKEVFDLDSIVDHAVQTVMPAIERHWHKLSVVKSPSPIWLDADRVRMGQVITNLLTNAAKYTPDGGNITLETSLDDGDACVSVRDNGVGISPAFLNEVFDLFAQAQRELARSEGGLGLGLTLARQLLELHGGQITVHSEGLGRGSEFRFRLPCAEPAANPAQRPDPTQRSDPAQRSEAPHASRPRCDELPDQRVLVVDDSVGSARILRRLLEAIGISRVEMAFDGPSAIETATTFGPDVIFLDIGLPCLSGYEVAEKLRGDSKFAGTRLVALTGYGTAEDRQKSRAAGFDEHLVKPVSLDQLKEVLAERTA